MTVKQLSVFAESRPGRLENVLQAFLDAGVSVKGFSVSDTGEFGITRYIVDDPEAAAIALRDMGSAFSTADVICCKLKDIPGELARVAGVLGDAGHNIRYSYSMISTYIVISAEDLTESEQILQAAGFEVVSQDKISSL